MIRLLATLLIACLFFAAKGDADETKDRLPQPPEGKTWKLVWHHEFAKSHNPVRSAKMDDWDDAAHRRLVFGCRLVECQPRVYIYAFTAAHPRNPPDFPVRLSEGILRRRSRHLG